MAISVRKATPEDAESVYGMIAGLSVYGHGLPPPLTSAEALGRTLFDPAGNTEAFICEMGGVMAGFAVVSVSYSAWLGRSGFNLEDLYFSPDYRGLGAGKALLQFIARQAVQRQFGRIEWSTLNWDQSAKDFYQSIDALPLNEWVRYRLDGAALQRFAGAEAV